MIPERFWKYAIFVTLVCMLALFVSMAAVSCRREQTPLQSPLLAVAQGAISEDCWTTSIDETTNSYGIECWSDEPFSLNLVVQVRVDGSVAYSRTQPLGLQSSRIPVSPQDIAVDVLNLPPGEVWVCAQWERPIGGEVVYWEMYRDNVKLAMDESGCSLWKYPNYLPVLILSEME